MQNVLLIDCPHPILIERLSANGFLCENYNPSMGKIEKIIGNYFGIIVRSKVIVTRELIDNGKKLNFIARLGSGMENIDVEYAHSKGIICFNSPEGNRDAVAEHCIGMLLNLTKRITISNQEVKSDVWLREKNRGLEIKGKTIGIIGFGNTGSEFAKRLMGFDLNILVYDKYKKGFANDYIKESNYNEIFENADILSLHIPLTDETHYLVDNDYIKLFKKNIFLINTSRGEVVKTSDLVSQLKSGKIIGAALDVIEYENLSTDLLEINDKPTFDYLASSTNVILTPHIAGWSTESKYKLASILADKIIINFKKTINI